MYFSRGCCSTSSRHSTSATPARRRRDAWCPSCSPPWACSPGGPPTSVGQRQRRGRGDRPVVKAPARLAPEAPGGDQLLQQRDGGGVARLAGAAGAVATHVEPGGESAEV